MRLDLRRTNFSIKLDKCDLCEKNTKFLTLVSEETNEISCIACVFKNNDEIINKDLNLALAELVKDGELIVEDNNNNNNIVGVQTRIGELKIEELSDNYSRVVPFNVKVYPREIPAGREDLIDNSRATDDSKSEEDKLKKFKTKIPSELGPNKNNNKRKLYRILKDCKYHCQECDIAPHDIGDVSKDVSRLAAIGFEFEPLGNPRSRFELKWCDDCGENTTHRKLHKPYPSYEATIHETITPEVREKILKYHEDDSGKIKDNFQGNRLNPQEVEIDHRRGEAVRIREGDKPKDVANMSIEELNKHFQVISSRMNNIKRDKCNECSKTRKRPPITEPDWMVNRQELYGEIFYYEGDEEYTLEVGCNGCAWYEPGTWSKEIDTAIINKARQTA